MIRLQTRLRIASAVEWDGSAKAAGEILALTTCAVSVVRLVGGISEMSIQLDADPTVAPAPVNLGESVVVGDDGTIGIWGKDALDRDFVPLLEEAPKGRKRQAVPA